MSGRLDQAEWRLDCLNSRLDALARADAESRSGSVTIVTSDEIDLGRHGGGEVEYAVKVSYKFELEYAGIRSIDWTITNVNGKEIDVPRNKVPEQAVRAAIEKRIARKRAELVSEAAGRL